MDSGRSGQSDPESPQALRKRDYFPDLPLAESQKVGQHVRDRDDKFAMRGRDGRGHFLPNHSGNPSGLPTSRDKPATDELARQLGRCPRRLAKWMRAVIKQSTEGGPGDARLICAILDRLDGKVASTTVENDNRTLVLAPWMQPPSTKPE